MRAAPVCVDVGERACRDRFGHGTELTASEIRHIPVAANACLAQSCGDPALLIAAFMIMASRPAHRRSPGSGSRCWPYHC